MSSFFVGWRPPGAEAQEDQVDGSGAGGVGGDAAGPAAADNRGPDPVVVAERTGPTLGSAPPPITTGDTLATAGRKVMWTHLQRMLAREVSLPDPERPDELRRYRVAIRRLRAAARMFRDAYPDREIRPIRSALRELARAVGTVRDLDLRIADLGRWSRERGDASRKGVAPLLQAWTAERARALGSLLANVASRRHQRLLGRLVEFVEARALVDRGARFAGPTTIGDRLASMIWAAYEEVRAYASVIRWADLETMHSLRIATKRLRDDLEFLADLIGPGRTPLLERLVALQDHLGAMNDAAVTATAVRAFLEEHHGQLRPAAANEIAAYLADRERNAARLKRSSVGPWRAVAGIPFARRLARIVVVPAGTPTAPGRTVPGRRPARTRREPAPIPGEAAPVTGEATPVAGEVPSVTGEAASGPGEAAPSSR